MSDHPEHRHAARRGFAWFVARAWSEESIRDAYERDPRAALEQAGVDRPAEAPTPTLPVRPDKALDLEELESSAGGALGTVGTVSCPTGCFSGNSSHTP
jgi:hypothetical protein